MSTFDTQHPRNSRDNRLYQVDHKTGLPKGFRRILGSRGLGEKHKSNYSKGSGGFGGSPHPAWTNMSSGGPSRDASLDCFSPILELFHTRARLSAPVDTKTWGLGVSDSGLRVDSSSGKGSGPARQPQSTRKPGAWGCRLSDRVSRDDEDSRDGKAVVCPC